MNEPRTTAEDTLTTLAEHASFGGVQGFYRHESKETGTPMKFGVFVPRRDAEAALPVLYFLAGLTCTEETFAIKAGAQRYAAEHGIVLVTPDTSPRATGVEGADADWDFGDGAGFYLDATQPPWQRHWRMGSYVTRELRQTIERHFPVHPDRIGIFGHSMGGHGALTLALRHPGLYRSVSALAPIAAPTRCPWGVKAFGRYLGDDLAAWAAHDATELVRGGARVPPLLIDQGLADQFLAEQLFPDVFEATCREAGQRLQLRRHPGYDHGYYFISSFVGDHIAHHARALHAA